MSAALEWTHTEPSKQSLLDSISFGYDRAELGDWTRGTDAERVRAWYGLWIETAYLMARMAGRVEPSDSGTLIDPSIAAAAPAARRRAALILYQTPYLLMLEHERSAAVETRVSPSGETGLAPVIAIPLIAAGVIVAVGQAAAIAYVATKGLELLNQELARRDDLKKLVQVHAQAMRIVREHVNREDQQGKQIPLDEAERSVLEGLNQSQKELAKKQAQPLAPELDRMGSAVATATSWLPWILGGAVVAYLVLSHPKPKVRQ